MCWGVWVILWMHSWIIYVLNFIEYFTLLISQECIYMLPTQKNIQTLKHLPQVFNVPLYFMEISYIFIIISNLMKCHIAKSSRKTVVHIDFLNFFSWLSCMETLWSLYVAKVNLSMGLDWQASELKFTCSWWYKENKSYWIDYDV